MWLRVEEKVFSEFSERGCPHDFTSKVMAEYITDFDSPDEQ